MFKSAIPPNRRSGSLTNPEELRKPARSGPLVRTNDLSMPWDPVVLPDFPERRFSPSICSVLPELFWDSDSTFFWTGSLLTNT